MYVCIFNQYCTCLFLQVFTGWSLRAFVKLTNLEFSPLHWRHRAGGILGFEALIRVGGRVQFWRILRLTLLLLTPTQPPSHLALLA